MKTQQFLNTRQIREYLNWISSALDAQKGKIGRLLLRLKDVGLRAGTGFALHKKFVRLLQQVAIDQEKELDILNEIEAVERRHEELRKKKLLRAFNPDAPRDAPALMTETPEPKPKRSSLWLLVGLWAVFSSPHKKGEEPRVR